MSFDIIYLICACLIFCGKISAILINNYWNKQCKNYSHLLLSSHSLQGEGLNLFKFLTRQNFLHRWIHSTGSKFGEKVHKVMSLIIKRRLKQVVVMGFHIQWSAHVPRRGKLCTLAPPPPRNKIVAKHREVKLPPFPRQCRFTDGNGSVNTSSYMYTWDSETLQIL